MQVKYVVILKVNPGILKGCGGIKMWMWQCVERGSYLEFRKSRNEKDRKKYIVRQKKNAKRVVYMAMYQKAWRRLIRVVIAVSSLELPNKGLGRREMLLG